jgi:hypothetical protein
LQFDEEFTTMNKRKYVKLFTLLMIPLILIPTITVVAGTYRSPSKDTYCDAQEGEWCDNGYGVQAGSSGIGACNPDQVGFIGWDLSSVTQTIETAQLTLTTYDVSGVPPAGVIVFELFIPSTQSWSEDITQTSPGASGSTLASTSVALTNGTNPQTVVFGGANINDAETLGAYFDGLSTGSSATVGVRISGGCSLGTLVAFNDREDSGELPGGAAATEPDLILFTPTAVSLSSLNASGQDSAANNTLFLAIGALVLTLAAVALLSALRKRNAALE